MAAGTPATLPGHGDGPGRDDGPGGRRGLGNKLSPLVAAHPGKAAALLPAAAGGQVRPGMRACRVAIAVAALCMAVSAASMLAGFSFRGALSGEDSWGPMRAAHTLLRTPAFDRLYETLFFEQRIKLQYPPTSLLVPDLLDALHLGAPRLLNCLNVVLVLVNSVLAGVLADAVIARPMRLHGRSRIGIAAAGALSALMFFPVVRGLQLGQIQIWLDLAFTAACVLLVQGRPFAAGAVMGFASLIKPQFIPLVVVAALLRRWRFAAGFAMVAATLGAVSVLRYGLHNHLGYLEVLRFISRHGESFYGNNSVNGVMNRWLANGGNLVWAGDQFAPYNPVVYAVTAAAGAAFIMLPLAVRPDQADPAGLLPHFCLSTLCFILASPIAWEHHYGVLPGMFIVAAGTAMASPPGRARRMSATILAAAWLLCASKLDMLVNRLSDTVLNPLQATHFAGALMLLIVLSWQIRSRKQGLRRTVPAADPTGMPLERRLWPRWGFPAVG